MCTFLHEGRGTIGAGPLADTRVDFPPGYGVPHRFAMQNLALTP